VAILAVTTLVMLLWNALLPVIFGVKAIGFLQALGLLILCKILFGSFGGHRMLGHGGREMRERWMAMSPEEREAFIKERSMHHRCGPWHGRGRHKVCSDEPRADEPHTDDSGKA